MFFSWDKFWALNSTKIKPKGYFNLKLIFYTIFLWIIQEVSKFENSKF